jgi:hypothetical protein
LKSAERAEKLGSSGSTRLEELKKNGARQAWRADLRAGSVVGEDVGVIKEVVAVGVIEEVVVVGETEVVPVMLVMLVTPLIVVVEGRKLVVVLVAIVL